MPNYNLSALNPTDFEHMIQALALKVLGPGVSIFGAGPDGAREATFNGAVRRPLTEEVWDGYGVIQAKFKTRPSEDHAGNLNWLKQELQGEKKKFASTKRKLKRPDYYVFVTNVVLTAAQNGTLDKFTGEMQKVATELGIQGFDVWHYEKICRLLDDAPGIRKTYAGALLAGDILVQLQETLAELGDKLKRPDFGKVMTVFLQAEMRDDLYARLEQAGHQPNQPVALSTVFVDVPAAVQPFADAPPTHPMPGVVEDAVEEMILEGGQCLRPTILIDSSRDENQEEGGVRVHIGRHGHRILLEPRERGEPGRFVLVGGPGQGKTTVGQFLCQLYRASILNTRPANQLTGETKSALEDFATQCNLSNISLPSVRRFPIRVVLDRFAAALSRKEATSLLDFIRQRIEEKTDSVVSAEDLLLWLQTSPWLLVLDGLDEVPASSNRTEMMNAIHRFCAQLAVGDADMMIVATTRPQGYSSEFGPEVYQHRYLIPLSVAQAMHYAERLVAARYNNELERQKKILNRLRQASQNKTTARLMRSPLQVTILAALVDVIGQPPQERWRLFSEYYQIVFRREIERDIELSRALSDNNDVVGVLHRRAGLLLQARSEETGGTEAFLSPQELRNLIARIFEEEEFSPSQVEGKVRDIYEAALDRLVFLVALQQNAIGFEVRSFQEFMASEALMDGTDEQIFKRLETIAPAPHWRNVFLFAAGRCFSDNRRHLREHVVNLCSQLNTTPPNNVEDELSTSSLLGSRLALELLLEDVARTSNRLKRQLLSLALQLVPWGSEDNAPRLASLYEEEFEALFRAQLSQCLSLSPFQAQRGGWLLVQQLALQGVTWANELARLRWPDEPEQALAIFIQSGAAIPDAWIEPFVLPLLPRLLPYRLDKLSRLQRQGSDARLHRDERLPDWARAMLFAVDDSFDRSATRIQTVLIHNQLQADKEQHSPTFSLALYGLGQSKFGAKELAGLKDIPTGSSSWAIYRAAPDFVRSPGCVSLAHSLQQIADEWEREDQLLPLEAQQRAEFSYGIPWPLQACVQACSNAEELRAEADRVERGERGDLADWQTAEQRWCDHALTEEDWNSFDNDNVPFSSDIARVGYPFNVCSYSITGSAPSWMVSFLYQRFLEASGEKAKRMWAQLCFNSYWAFEENNIPEELKSVEMWRQLISNLTTTFVSVDWLFEALAEGELDQPEIEFLDWLGRQEHVLYAQASYSALASRIALAYSHEPYCWGLLRLLAIAMSSEEPPLTPVHPSSAPFDFACLGNVSALVRHEVELSLLLLDMTLLLSQGQGDLEDLARRAVELDLRDRTRGFLDVILTHARLQFLSQSSGKGDDVYQRFFLAIWKTAQLQGQGQERELVITLSQLTSTRRSRLTSESVWRSLSLPELPAKDGQAAPC